MRRTLADGETRFVTPAKLLALITAADGLMGVGFTESMDSAISREVLEGLLFRDGKLMAPSRLRGVSMERPRTDRSQRRLQSLDLCGCVSTRFQEGLRSFVDLHLRKFSNRHTSTLVEESEASSETETDGEDERRGRGRETARDRTMSRSDAGRSSASRSQTRSLSRYGRDDDEVSQAKERCSLCRADPTASGTVHASGASHALPLPATAGPGKRDVPRRPHHAICARLPEAHAPRPDWNTHRAW